MIQGERIARLNERPGRGGRYVLYWMQASQRAECNHALEYAIEEANGRGQPLVACFGLTGDYPHANARHYYFLLHGLAETQGDLARRGVQLVVRHGRPDAAAAAMARVASLVVTDCGYLEHQRRWRRRLAREVGCPVVQVESDVVVPVATASDKLEYSAATLRGKIHKRLGEFLVALEARQLKRDSLGMHFDSCDLSEPERLMAGLGVDMEVKPVRAHRPGAAEAQRRLARFCKKGLAEYDEARNDPNRPGQSGLSPYLHFGQISPLAAALAASRRRGAEAFLEELIVRRELAINFVYYGRRYQSPAGLPPWVRATLRRHQSDRRGRVYSRAELESGRTDDPYWNAAQREMVLTGKMHGYMRMYWGKKIIEWSGSVAAAYGRAIYLNDKYELDGRDANGYAGVAWCFGRHDRPWKEREVFGTVRYMNAAGLRRKFDADEYVRQMEGLRWEEEVIDLRGV